MPVCLQGKWSVKKKKNQSHPSSSSLAKEWDATLQTDDLVVIPYDSSPHVYKILAMHRRVVMDHDLYNSPSLLSRGYKPGDELSPLLHVRRVRVAPFWDVIPPGHTVDRKVEAHSVSKITVEQIRSVIENLVSMMVEISPQDPTDEV